MPGANVISPRWFHGRARASELGDGVGWPGGGDVGHGSGALCKACDSSS